MQKWSKEKVIDELKSMARELGHSPSRSEISNALYGACNQYFGNMNNAKRAAGLSTQKLKYNPIKKSAYNLSIEFAYVIGVVYGDGNYNLQENEHGSSGSISLGVRDEDFAINFKERTERWSGLKAKYYFDKNNFYRVILHSVDACRIIKNFDINDILKWRNKFQFEFLKGLFDSDGGVVVSNLANRKYAKRWIHLSNNNVQLVKLVTCIFDKMDIKYSVTKRIHSGFGSKKLQHEIKVYNFDGILKYYKNIGFSIKRKQLQIAKLVNSYDLGIDLYNAIY